MLNYTSLRFMVIMLVVLMSLVLSGCITILSSTPGAAVTPASVQASTLCPTPIIGGLRGAPTTVTPGETTLIYLDDVSAAGPVSYTWTVLPGNIIAGQNSSVIQYQAPTSPGTYMITVKISACNFQREMSAPVTVSTTPTPTATITTTSAISLPCPSPVLVDVFPYGPSPCKIESSWGIIQYCPSMPEKFVADVELHDLKPNNNYILSLQASKGATQTNELLRQSCQGGTTLKGDAYCDTVLQPMDEQGSSRSLVSIPLEPGRYDLKFLLKDANTPDYCTAMYNDGPITTEVKAFQKGITFVTWQSDDFSTTQADEALAELAATGANWLALVVTGYQDTAAATTIQVDPLKTPTDDDLSHVINQARQLGLKVMLKPHLDLLNDPGHWRGEIGTGFSETEWQTWFTSYREFINHYAELAAQNEDVVKIFVVGTELVATSPRDTDWKQVIEEVRSRFNGQLVYAGNWDEPARAWWTELDYIGVDAYFPLETGSQTPTVEELKTAWLPHIIKLSELHQQYGKPLILTELGYRSIRGAYAAPAQWQEDAPPDPTEQANLYQAALETFCKQEWLAGIYWWNWLTDPAQGGSEDIDYTPHQKPAEAVLKEYYQEGKCDRDGTLRAILAPFDKADGCPINGSSGEVLYDSLSTGYFRASVKIVGLKPNHTYVFAINCQEQGASCPVLARVKDCKEWNGQGYCDLRLGRTDETGLLEANIEKPLPAGQYQVRFFVKDPASNWCIPLYNDRPEPFTVE